MQTMEEKQQSQWLSLKEAAAELNIPYSTLHTHVFRYKILPASQTMKSSYWRIRREDLEAYKEKYGYK